jgi:hypothetical protein
MNSDPVRIVVDLDDRGTPKMVNFGTQAQAAFQKAGTAAASEGGKAAASVDRLCGVTTLSLLDAFTEKLLANTDRGLDRSTNSRDLIDLLALSTRHGDIPDGAWQKAEGAYGNAVRRAFRQSALLLRDDRAHWRQCMSRLSIDPAWEASIAAPLARLSAAF